MAGFIRFPGDLVGECNQISYLGQQAGYLGWIVLNSYSQGIRRPVEDGRSGAARFRAETILQDIQIEKEVDLASPKLMDACGRGVVFPFVLIDLCVSAVAPPDAGDLMEATGSLVPYMKITIEDVLIEELSVQLSGGDAGDIPTENLTLNFDRISWEYIPLGDSVQYIDNQVSSVYYPPNDPGPVSPGGWNVVISSPYYKGREDIDMEQFPTAG